jgi:hypothetical protein
MDFSIAPDQTQRILDFHADNTLRENFSYFQPILPRLQDTETVNNQSNNYPAPKSQKNVDTAVARILQTYNIDIIPLSQEEEMKISKQLIETYSTTTSFLNSSFQDKEEHVFKSPISSVEKLTMLLERQLKLEEKYSIKEEERRIKQRKITSRIRKEIDDFKNSFSQNLDDDSISFNSTPAMDQIIKKYNEVLKQEDTGNPPAVLDILDRVVDSYSSEDERKDFEILEKAYKNPKKKRNKKKKD